MDLRLELIQRLAAGEKASDLRREYGVSKKTVNKFRKRFASLGMSGLEATNRGLHRFNASNDCYVTSALAGENVGIREERDGRWLVTSASIDLGHFDGSKLIPKKNNTNDNAEPLDPEPMYPV